MTVRSDIHKSSIFNFQYSIFNSPINRDLRFATTGMAGLGKRAMRKKAELKGFDPGPLQVLQERKPLGQHVFDNLKQAIIRGKIAPGEWLVESHIAEMLGISRTPVREAIHKLERERLIERQPRGGFTVLGLNRGDIDETFGIRSVLEGYAARLATLKHQPKELKALEKKIEEYKHCLDKKQLKALPEINTEFHELL